MSFCSWVLTPIIIFIRTLVQVVRDVVRTVCEWVSSTIRTVIQVVEKVCDWLPWPLSELCKWVTKLVEVVQTVWNWVCHDVIDRIISWVEVVLEYIYYILHWVCWIIDWGIRGPEFLLCLLGLEPTKFINVCIKVLTDDEGNPAVAASDVEGMLRDAAAIFRRCKINLVVLSNELVRKPEFLDGTTCDFSGLFSDFFVWFSANACTCCSAITVYFVHNIMGGQESGCAYPGSNWVIIGANADGTVVVHEIGHLADLTHTSDPNNVMTDQQGGTHDQLTHVQCCLIRTSRFANVVDQTVQVGIQAPATGATILEPAEVPFKRQEIKPEAQTADMERLVGSRWFAVVKIVGVVAAFVYAGMAIARWKARTHQGVRTR